MGCAYAVFLAPFQRGEFPTTTGNRFFKSPEWGVHIGDSAIQKLVASLESR